MKGLLVKDYNILLLQSRFLMLILGISAILILTMENPSFLIGYVTIICSMQALSTISYDDFDNGYSFLFTLPVTRKDYVLEKYIMAVLVGGAAWLISTIASLIVSVVKVEQYVIGEGIVEALLIMSACMSLSFIAIPIQLKYGSEKARIVQFAVAGVVGMAIYFLDLLVEKLNGIVSINMEGLFNAVASIGAVGLTVGAILFMLAVMLITIFASMRVMEKKEF